MIWPHPNMSILSEQKLLTERSFWPPIVFTVLSFIDSEGTGIVKKRSRMRRSFRNTASQTGHCASYSMSTSSFADSVVGNSSKGSNKLLSAFRDKFVLL